MSRLFTPLTLQSGLVLQNRVAKAAMEQDMAEYGRVPGAALVRLYRFWAEGRPGMIITGNIMVTPDAMHGPGAVYLGQETLNSPAMVARFERWTSAPRSGSSPFYARLSHPGRQVFRAMKTEAVSASATRVRMKGPLNRLFKKARALTRAEIESLILRFGESARAADACGFDGVQIHAAHGYPVAQFLSPLSNHRRDEWGGSLEGRARFLLEVVRAAKARTFSGFSVAVKLNSADFQRGGFDENDARQVVAWLNAEGVDIVELSGGSYESAAMMGATDEASASSTLLREIYFIEFAKLVHSVAEMRLMVTGGITKRATTELALATGAAEVVGLARALGARPYLPVEWQAGKNLQVAVPRSTSRLKTWRVVADMATTKSNLYAMGKGRLPADRPNPVWSIMGHQLKQRRQTRAYRRWLATRGQRNPERSRDVPGYDRGELGRHRAAVV